MDECGERGIWSAVGRHWGASAGPLHHSFPTICCPRAADLFCSQQIQQSLRLFGQAGGLMDGLGALAHPPPDYSRRSVPEECGGQRAPEILPEMHAENPSGLVLSCTDVPHHFSWIGRAQCSASHINHLNSSLWGHGMEWGSNQCFWFPIEVGSSWGYVWVFVLLFLVHNSNEGNPMGLILIAWS